MSEPKEDALDFIKEIRIEQYWRRELGDMGYNDYNPADLRRWYEAMELRGPEDINAYVIERSGRHPAGCVTGIVASEPHPPMLIVNMWLSSQDRAHTGTIWLGVLVFLVFSILTATNLAGVPYYVTPNLQASIRQPAVLTTGTLSGAPPSAASGPQFAPGQPYAYQSVGARVQGYQPVGSGMVAQQGTAFQTQVGASMIGQAAATPGASASSAALNGPGGNPMGAGIASPGPSAYQSSAFTGAGMHNAGSASTGNSSHLTGLTSPTGQ